MLPRRALIGAAASALAIATPPLQVAPALPVRPRQAMTEFWSWLMDLSPRDEADADRLIRAGITERLGPLPARFVSPDYDVTVHGYDGLWPPGRTAPGQIGAAAEFRVTLLIADAPPVETILIPFQFAQA